ncbi:MAG: hypothetical protein MJ252_24925, partial [archaeon]|nr:hypothetical protein [archaeon]
MKQPLKLPPIKTKEAQILRTETDELDLRNASHHFTDLLTKFHQKKNGRRKRMKLNTEVGDIEEQEQEEIKEDRTTRIRNQKFMIRLYQSDHPVLMEEIKDENKDYLKMKKEGKLDQYIPHNPCFEKFTGNTTVYSSEDTMKEFYNKFKEFKFLNRKQALEKYTASFAFIRGANEEKIVPNPLGLIKRSGEDSKLEMNNQKVGDRYMKVLSKSLGFTNHLSSVHFKGNRLSSQGANTIISSLNNNQNLVNRVDAIDLSDNLIGRSDISEILNYLNNPSNVIEDFNISGNRLGDENMIKICNALTESVGDRIMKLDIGNNCLTRDSMPSICKMLQSCKGLRVLRLNNNQFDNKSATDLLKIISTHPEIRILDLSWNCIGAELLQKPQFADIANANMESKDTCFTNYELEQIRQKGKISRGDEENNLLALPMITMNPFIADEANQKGQQKKDKKDEAAQQVVKKKALPIPAKKPSEFAKLLGELVHKEVPIVHLDISHNNLAKEDCAIIANELKDNHSILGIHVDGNEMCIDSLGFVHAFTEDVKEDSYFAYSQIYYDIEKDYDLKKSTVEKVRKIRSKNNCWICEGWREIDFEYIPKEPMEDIQDHLVKLHLSCDGYKPFDMLYVKGRFHIVRACPPGDIHYFFTVDTKVVTEEGEKSENKYKHLNKKNQFDFTFDDEYMDELNNIRARLYYDYKQKEKERKDEYDKAKQEYEDKIRMEAEEKARREEEERLQKEEEERV